MQHLIGFEGLLTFSRDAGLAHCRREGVGLQVSVGQEEPVQTSAKGTGVWGCSCLFDCLVVVVVVVLPWPFRQVFRTKLTSLIDSSQ